MEEQVTMLAGMTGCSYTLQDLHLARNLFIPNYLSLIDKRCLLCVITTCHLEKRKKEEKPLLLGNFNVGHLEVFPSFLGPKIKLPR